MFTLCARLTGSPNFVVAGTPQDFPVYAVLFLDPNPDEPYAIFDIYPKGLGNPNFPYGNDVEPD